MSVDPRAEVRGTLFLGTRPDLERRHLPERIGGFSIELADCSVDRVECDPTGPEDVHPGDDGVVREGRSPRLVRWSSRDSGEQEFPPGADGVHHMQIDRSSLDWAMAARIGV